MYTVLVIDDDKSTLNILEPQLRPYDYRIITEISPIKGVELAKEFTPDVILLDLNMPLMNGFEVMRILRKDKLTKEIPIVIFTIDKDKETVINALRSGAIDYIVKPYNPYQLGWKIKSAIQYGISKKLQNQDEFIEVSHKGEIFVITMRGEIRETGFQNALKKIFNAFFMKQIHGKICIFDIKEIKDVADYKCAYEMDKKDSFTKQRSVLTKAAVFFDSKEDGIEIFFQVCGSNIDGNNGLKFFYCITADQIAKSDEALLKPLVLFD